jgi:hypothetical protein
MTKMMGAVTHHDLSCSDRPQVIRDKKTSHLINQKNEGDKKLKSLFATPISNILGFYQGMDADKTKSSLS